MLQTWVFAVRLHLRQVWGSPGLGSSDPPSPSPPLLPSQYPQGGQPTIPRQTVPTRLPNLGCQLAQLRPRSQAHPPSGGGGMWRGWGLRGRVAPAVAAQPQQPDGQTEGPPAKGGVISPGSASWSANFKHPIPNIWPLFFFFLTPKQIPLQRGLLAPDWGAVGCSAIEGGCSRRRDRGGKTWGGFSGGKGGWLSGCQPWERSLVQEDGRVGGRTDRDTNKPTLKRERGQDEARTHLALFPQVPVPPSALVSHTRPPGQREPITASPQGPEPSRVCDPS